MARPHLICFGDSLTAGYQSVGYGHDCGGDTPYGGFLQAWLGQRGTVTVTGICGEVTLDMRARFHRDVVSHHPTTVVILGGTNDLGCGLTPSAIMTNLEDLYRQASEAGIQAVGVTVPSIYLSDEMLMGPGKSPALEGQSRPHWIHSHITHRHILNGLIQHRCSVLQIPCVDLFHETAEGPHAVLAPRYSNDGLHLSTLGYERFAELVWQVLFEARFGRPIRQEFSG